MIAQIYSSLLCCYMWQLKWQLARYKSNLPRWKYDRNKKASQSKANHPLANKSVRPGSVRSPREQVWTGLGPGPGRSFMWPITWGPPPHLSEQTDRQTRLKIFPSRWLRMRAVTSMAAWKLLFWTNRSWNSSITTFNKLFCINDKYFVFEVEVFHSFQSICHFTYVIWANCSLSGSSSQIVLYLSSKYHWSRPFSNKRWRFVNLNYRSMLA